VILTYRLWKHLGANPKIVGQTIQINGASHVVVGVLVPGAADRWDWQLIVPYVFKPEELRDRDSRGCSSRAAQAGVTIQSAVVPDGRVIRQENGQGLSHEQIKVWGRLWSRIEMTFLPSDRLRTLRLLLGAVGFSA